MSVQVSGYCKMRVWCAICVRLNVTCDKCVLIMEWGVWGWGLVDEVACASMSVAVLLMRLYHALFIILYQTFDVLHEKFRPDFALFFPPRIIVHRFVAIRISAQRICKLYTQNFERIKLFVCLHSSDVDLDVAEWYVILSDELLVCANNSYDDNSAVW